MVLGAVRHDSHEGVHVCPHPHVQHLQSWHSAKINVTSKLTPRQSRQKSQRVCRRPRMGTCVQSVRCRANRNTSGTHAPHPDMTSKWIMEGTTRVEDAQGTPIQNHTSPSILVCEDELFKVFAFRSAASGFRDTQMLGGTGHISSNMRPTSQLCGGNLTFDARVAGVRGMTGYYCTTKPKV